MTTRFLSRREPIGFPWLAVFCIGLVVFCSGAVPVRADDADFRTLMAEAIRAAAGRVLPSVVTIEIIGASGAANGDVEQDAPTSGVIIDDQGFIIGSSIVVRKPSASILIVLPDGTRHAAKVVARDYHRDLVLLKIDTDKPLTAIEFPSELDLRIGETTIAVGRYGFDASPMVSSGVLSGTDRLDGIALQTDARVSPALYGGPLIDLSGNVLGVLIPAVAEGGAEDATSWYDSGIAFAIPSAVLKRKLDRLRRGEDIKKGLIGIIAKSKDPYENETEIAAVRNRSPADAAGIKPGDKVIAVDGKPVRRHQEIRQVLGSFDAGEAIRIKLERDGSEQDVEVTLTDTIPPLEPQRLGLIAIEQQRSDERQPDDKEKSEEVKSVVVVDSLLPGSAAERSLQVGDIITRIGETELNDIESFRRRMISAEPQQAIKVTYQREGVEGSAEVMPTSIAGKIVRAVPQSWQGAVPDDWSVETFKLPEMSNAAAVISPKKVDDLRQLGLLVLLLNPGEGAPEEVLKKWNQAAPEAGVVVCAIAPENNGRWQPKELDVVSRFAAAVLKKAPIEESAVAVAAAGALAGGKAEAADSMALAVAVSQSNRFFGVAISPETRPPAIRVGENEASASLQVLLPITSSDDLPTWAVPLEQSGYPIVLGGDVDRSTLLSWVRLLQAI